MHKLKAQSPQLADQVPNRKEEIKQLREKIEMYLSTIHAELVCKMGQQLEK